MGSEMCIRDRLSTHLVQIFHVPPEGAEYWNDQRILRILFSDPRPTVLLDSFSNLPKGILEVVHRLGTSGLVNGEPDPSTSSCVLECIIASDYCLSPSASIALGSVGCEPLDT